MFSSELLFPAHVTNTKNELTMKADVLIALLVCNF